MHRDDRPRCTPDRPATVDAACCALVAVVTLVGLVLLGGPAPAAAHDDLLGSTPRDGDTTTLRADRLVLVFADDLLPGSAQVVASGPDGVDVAGQPVLDGATLEVPLTLRSPGAHVATYRVLADDGHAVVGEVSFDVATRGSDVSPVAGLPAPGPSPDRGGRLPSSGWVLTGCAAATVVLFSRRARRPHGDGVRSRGAARPTGRPGCGP